MGSITMSTAALAANAQQLRIEVISNNVANVNTDGFKKLK